jgi:GNAT superfamily N-acetyltransferase
MEIRELRESDSDAVLDLCRRCFPTEPFTATLLRHHTFDVPAYNPAHLLSAWDGERLAAVMLGGVERWREQPAMVLRLFATDPAYRRQGLASLLLQELERRARAAGFAQIKVGNNTAYYFWPGLDVRYTPAFCLLQRHGFRCIGEAVNMDVDLLARDWDTSAEEARLSRDGLTVRRLRPDDREAFSAWLERQWSPVWHFEGLSSYQRDPISTFIVTFEERICAFASYGVSNFENGFGPTGTEPDMRGRGLGRVLLHACMRDIRALGHQKAEICWVGPITFYARAADAWISRVFWFLEKAL